MAEQPKYESPLKKILGEQFAKIWEMASLELRESLKGVLEDLDHTDPQVVRALLPPDVEAFYRHTSERGLALVPLIKHSHDRGCFIQSIVLSHGLALFSLRALYVFAWQRLVMPEPLSSEQLAPYYSKKPPPREIVNLAEFLESEALLNKRQLADVQYLNDTRNNAAHGVIFGDIAQEDLADASGKCQHATFDLIHRLKVWFMNPLPLKAPRKGDRARL